MLFQISMTVMRATLCVTVFLIAIALLACRAPLITDPPGDSGPDASEDADGDRGQSDEGTGGDPYRPDPNADLDGDGFSINEGDCDEGEPAINPMAIEAPDNARDDDCDGSTDEAIDTCDCLGTSSLPSALDLCDSRFFLASSESSDAPGSAGASEVLSHYGSTSNGLAPRLGCAYAVLATANVGDQCSPVWGCADSPRQPGLDFYDDGYWSYCGDDYIGESDPDPDGSDGATICDTRQLHLSLRAPSNASGFSFDFVYMSTEYPEWVQEGYNDTFYAIVDRPAAAERRNISFDERGQEIEIDNAFFEDPPTTSIAGTGYDGMCLNDSGGYEICGSSTGWLRTSWNVDANEEFTLIFSIHDEGDGYLDSAVIIDNFQWSLVPVDEGTQII